MVHGMTTGSATELAASSCFIERPAQHHAWRLTKTIAEEGKPAMFAANTMTGAIIEALRGGP